MRKNLDADMGALMKSQWHWTLSETELGKIYPNG